GRGVPRGGPPPLLPASARRRRGAGRAAGSDARAGHRRRLSTRHRAVLALLRGAPGVTVRRRGAHRSDARGGAPRTLTVVDSGAAGDVPLRAVRAYTSGRVRRRGRREGERRLPGPR